MGYYPSTIRRANAILAHLRSEDNAARPGRYITHYTAQVTHWVTIMEESTTTIMRALRCLREQGLIEPAGELAADLHPRFQWFVISEKGRKENAKTRPEGTGVDAGAATARLEPTTT